MRSTNKNQLFLYTSNEQSEEEIKKTNPFINIMFKMTSFEGRLLESKAQVPLLMGRWGNLVQII